MNREALLNRGASLRRNSRLVVWALAVSTLSSSAGCFSSQPDLAAGAINAANRANEAASRAEAAALRASAAAAGAQAAASRVEQAASDAVAAADRSEAIASPMISSAHHRHYKRHHKAGGGEALNITQHRYDLVNHRNGEPDGYAVYTYVLFGRDIGRNVGSTDDNALRYQALLDAINADEIRSLGDSGLVVPAEQTDLFCVPAKSSNGRLKLSNYDFALSSDLMVFARNSIFNTDKFWPHFHNPGPILVSTIRTPLEETAVGDSILFADLSTTNTSAMTAVVAAYELKLEQAPPRGPEVFEPIRLRVLSKIYDADDNVALTKKAYAEVIPPSENSSERPEPR